MRVCRDVSETHASFRSFLYFLTDTYTRHMNGIVSSTLDYNGQPHRTVTYRWACRGTCGKTYTAVIVCGQCAVDTACHKHLGAMEAVRCPLCRAAPVPSHATGHADTNSNAAATAPTERTEEAPLD